MAVNLSFWVLQSTKKRQKSHLVVPQCLDKWRKMWYNYKNNSIMVNYTCFLTTIKYLALLMRSIKMTKGDCRETDF